MGRALNGGTRDDGTLVPIPSESNHSSCMCVRTHPFSPSHALSFLSFDEKYLFGYLPTLSFSIGLAGFFLFYLHVPHLGFFVFFSLVLGVLAMGMEVKVTVLVLRLLSVLALVLVLV